MCRGALDTFLERKQNQLRHIYKYICMTYTYTYVEVERHVYVCLRAYTVVHAVGAICVSGRSGYYACQPVHRHGYPVNVANRCYVVVGWCVWSLARVRGCRAACSRSGPTNSCELARLRAHVLTRVGREARGHMYVHTRWPRWGGGTRHTARIAQSMWHLHSTVVQHGVAHTTSS